MIVHVHIPKNAGSTFNSALRGHFRSGYVDLYCRDKPGYFYSQEELADLIATHRDAQAVASHSIRYPLPDLPGISYEYVTFLRDPIDRAVSLYFYEKKISAGRSVEHCSQLPFAILSAKIKLWTNAF